MKIGIILTLLIALTIWYALWGRSWLKTKPWSKRFFDWVEPIEIKLYKKSETILLARVKVVTGILLTVLTYLGTLDLTPLMPFFPDKYEAALKAAFNLLPLTISLLGLIDEKLRNQTTLPLELVAVSEANASPRIKEAIALADSTKTEAVEVVKANGGV